MKMMFAGKAAAAVLVAVMVSGCADGNRVSALENDVAALRAEVARVKATADKAAADASAALVEARAASEKVDRMYRKGLRK